MPGRLPYAVSDPSPPRDVGNLAPCEATEVACPGRKLPGQGTAAESRPASLAA